MSVDDDGGGAGRPAGAATFRGILVIVAAVVVGALLLSRGLVDDGSAVAGEDDQQATEPTTGGDGAAAPAAGEGATPTTTPPEPTTTAPRALRQPAEVRVLVLNGSGRSGEAGRGSQFFSDAGYVVADPQNAPETGPSAIYYAEGFAGEAEAAAAALGVEPAAVVKPIDPAAPPTTDLQDADLVVVAGTDGTIAF